MEPENTDNCYPLDETAIAMFSDIRSQIQLLNQQAQGALLLYLRQHKLDGPWKVADNGRELVRMTSEELSHDHLRTLPGL